MSHKDHPLRARFSARGHRKSGRPLPIWFGPADHSLAGFLHEPRTPGAHGTVICAPFGYESICAYRSLRELADRLAEAGQLVLRFDYEGAGASAGTGVDHDLLGRWQASVAAAIAELRDRGIARPSLVGVRLGAALACAAAADDDQLGPLALWAPVTSGRRYVRELRALAVTTPGGVMGDGSLNVVGLPVQADLAGALSRWDPLAGLAASHPLLVVQSPEWRDKAKVAKDFQAAGLCPVTVELGGTEGVLERDAELAVVPHDILAAIVSWVTSRGGRGGGPDQTAAPSPTARPNQLSRTISTGTVSVHEQIVAVPGHDLYGVVTDPVDGPSRVGVVFLNNGAAPAAGPGRAWVQFGRELAGDGVSSLRFDISGLGDSPDHVRPRGKYPNVAPRSAAHDVLAATQLLRDRGCEEIAVVGLCSGAQIALRTFSYAGRVDLVFAINPPLYSHNDIGIGPPMRRVWHYTTFAWSKRPIRRLMLRLPERVWTVFERLGVFPAPTRYLRRPIERGASVHLLLAEGGAEITDICRRAPVEAQRLVNGGRARIDVIPGLDHSMFDLDQRRTVLDALKTALRRGRSQPDDHVPLPAGGPGLRSADNR